MVPSCAYGAKNILAFLIRLASMLIIEKSPIPSFSPYSDLIEVSTASGLYFLGTMGSNRRPFEGCFLFLEATFNARSLSTNKFETF